MTDGIGLPTGIIGTMSRKTPDGPASEPTTYNLLFVCTGNTCRSPMASGIARKIIAERGWSHVSATSAGVAAAEGAPASELAVRVAGAANVDLREHRSRMLTPALVEWADLVLVMSPSHAGVVGDLGGSDKVAMVTEFVDDDTGGEPVEDPFGTDEESYRRAFRQLERAVAGVIARLEPILSP